MLRYPAEIGARHLGSVVLLLFATQLASCASARPRQPPPAPPPPTGSSAPGSVAASGPGPFRWVSAVVPAVRVTPLDRSGEPVPCVTGDTRRPCDIEVTAAGKVFYRSKSPAPVGTIGPGLVLRRLADGRPAFTLEATGALAGAGLFQPPDAPQVLFCRLTEEPALRCHHELRESVRGRVWNEENCTGSFVIRVDQGAIRVTSLEDPAATSLASARLDPPPVDAAGEGLALFLYAMELVDNDTTHHTPYVDDMQAP